MRNTPLTNDQLRQWDREHYWHSFTQMAEYQPLIIESAQGCVLTDIDGRELVDGVSSLWCNVHGHRHPRLDAALTAQLKKVAHVTSLGHSNPTTIELAKRLVDITPAGLQHAFFSDSGATSVEVALKIAFQYWQQCATPKPNKTKYAALTLAYHGDTIGVVSVGGVARFHEIFGPLLYDVVRIPGPDLYRRPEGVTREGALEYFLQQVETIFREQHESLAAIILEPLVQGAAGMVTHPPGYLKGLRELATKYDILLIADEVATGFGRTGKMFACEHEGISPDLMCLAKGISGGYLPLAATMATSEIYQAFLGSHAESRTFFHGHTYGGNPLAAAVALASLEVFEEEQTLVNLQPKIDRLSEHLARIAEHPHVGDVRQCGFMAGIELVADKANKTPYPWEEKRGNLACDEAIRQGVWLRPLGNVVILMPPLAVSVEQLDSICQAASAGIDAATA